MAPGWSCVCGVRSFLPPRCEGQALVFCVLFSFAFSATVGVPFLVFWKMDLGALKLVIWLAAQPLQPELVQDDGVAFSLDVAREALVTLVGDGL